MSKGPGLFSDIGKKAKDLLTKDYITDQKFSVSNFNDAGMAIISTGKKKGVSTFLDVAVHDRYKYKNTLVDVRADTNSHISATFTFTDIVPSTKTIALLKFPDYDLGMVEVQYFHHHATLTSAVSLRQAPAVDVSATIGTDAFTLGAEASYDTDSCEFTNYSAGFNVVDEDWHASMILYIAIACQYLGNFSHSLDKQVEVQYFHHHATLTSAVSLRQAPAVDVSATIGTHAFTLGAEASYDTDSCEFTNYSAGFNVVDEDWHASMILGDKRDSVTWSFVYYLDKQKQSASAAEITRRFLSNKYSFTVGGSYAVDSLTMFKAKLNNWGRVAALWQRELVPKSFLTLSCEIDTKALYTRPRFGLALSLKP